MELKSEANFNDLLKVIHHLPDEDIEKLASSLQIELSSRKKKAKLKIQDLILNAPTWNEEQLSAYEKARKHINSSRLI